MSKKKRKETDVQKQSEAKDDLSNAIDLVLSIRELEKKDPGATRYIKGVVDGASLIVKKS